MEIKKIEVDGISVEIPMERLEDMDTIEAMSDIQEGNALKIVPLFRRIFGGDYSRIKTELKGDSETLSVETMTNWFTKAMEALNAKN
ncbi:hypothetical protein [Eubacterium sp.]|uniref:hypothetical protein n=1 Tax=Eubacterium sp. TaxID=142586 RepID=UPI002FC9A561